MNTVILVGIFAATLLELASAAALRNEEPYYENQYEDYMRTVPSYATQYVSPCAAAAAGAMQVYPNHYQGYGSPQYHYGPHYRSVDEQLGEMMAFSDTNFQHLPMARLGGVSSLGGSVLTPGALGSAYGVFPGANVGGCGVPLFFSCTPSVVSGHMMPQASGAHLPGPPAYRLVDDAHHAVQPHEELLNQENVNHLPTSQVTKS